MRCQLCGYEFDETQMRCHTSCPLNTYCAIICCPNCGYQTADESKSHLISGLRRLFKAKRGIATVTPRSENTMPSACKLSTLRAGQTAQLVAIDTPKTSRLERLQVYGLIPGATVVLKQRSPEFVISVGHTELAIERAIADQIMVTLDMGNCSTSAMD